MRLKSIPLLLSLSLSSLQAQTNVVVIISDDAGFPDWEFMDDYIQTLNPGQAASPIPTPNLNALRNRGVLFTNAYTASVCSPSRAAIVTGSYQQRIGYEYNINNSTGATANDGLHPSTVTIFDRMKAEGYTTGAIGKWHIGARDNASGLGNRPENQGVDEFFGIWKGSRNYTVGGVNDTGTLRETITTPFSDTVLESTAPWNTTYSYVTNAFGQGALNFIDAHYSDPEPFFLYVAFTAPHGPIGDSPDIGDARISGLTGKRKQYASMILTMDKEIGRILDKIDDPVGDGSISLTDDTLIIFINDNGGASGNGTINTPLNNWKGSTYEGGTRVPMIMAGPGVPSNPGTPISFDKPVHSIDILPTCVNAAGGTDPAGIDGVNLLPFADGTNTGDPHAVITIRSGSKVGVRKGDWKLTKNSAGGAFQLYDLATDIGEATDISGANPLIVADLLNDFTIFETGNDKPRHPGLGKGNNSINFNDEFILDPQQSGDGVFTPEATIVGGPLLNGDFNEDVSATDQRSFADTPNWVNIGTGDQTSQATRSNVTAPDGSRNAVLSENDGRQFGLDTGHDLVTDQEFRVTYEWRDASNWSDANDRVRITLFTTNDNTITGVRSDIQFIDSTGSAANSTYQDETHIFDAVTGAVDTKRLFVSIDTNSTGSGFARLDNFTLERGTSSNTTLPVVPLDWSDADIWTDADTLQADTLLTLDAFPGAILEFPTRNNFSYVATNDMTRISDLDFMLNQLQFTGTFGGASGQSATLDGNDLLLTNNLIGNSPALNLTANGADYSFLVQNNLILYDDLVISGNGSANLTLSGAISEYDDPRGITKNGNSTVLLSGTLTYSGATFIDAGTLLIGSGATLSNSPMTIATGATLGGNGTITADVTGTGIIAPGQSIGTLTASGNVTTNALAIEVDGATNDTLVVGGELTLPADAALSLLDLGGGYTEPAYVIATYGTLTGTFAGTTNLPENYTIDYTYDDGLTTNNIALVNSGVIAPYEYWSQILSTLSGPDAAFDADPNGDGLQNGVAFFLGAANGNIQALSLAPTATNTGGDLKFSFTRADVASFLMMTVEYGNTLHGWTAAVHGLDSVNIATDDDAAGPGLDLITVTLPSSLAVDSKLFARLVVTQP